MVRRKNPPPKNAKDPIVAVAESVAHKAEDSKDHGSSIFQLIICVGGIYASFLTWALLQERITTTPYGADKKIFRSPLVLNTVQSLFAALTGYVYFSYSSSADQPPRVFPNLSISLRLLLVALTQSLASPFGYASLQHIDYITYILAKSCKLLPVMFLHITIFRRRYPLYKYAVVFLVTAGVAIFTLYPAHPKKLKKSTSSTGGEEKNVVYGMLLLGVNLLFDGLTNTIQDDIFSCTPKGIVSGPQMMTALNTISSVLTIGYLLLNPWSTELNDALAFVQEHPKIGMDIMGFAVCGGLGQVFICGFSFQTTYTFQSVIKLIAK
ncbi:UAA transporter [Choiromyces venosus 120613-1]|uniref:UDP-galactose transporter homolog 1 n=1 Tax=Choiromyces venosus 120613-1 TaxID=1336337 RepID=A0A3N4IVX8_9PEZI|nr:UAA transporter [Choiromyces venosus 120613-1]